MLEIKRLDHFGLAAGVIKDLGLIELIDKHCEYDDTGIFLQAKQLQV